MWIAVAAVSGFGGFASRARLLQAGVSQHVLQRAVDEGRLVRLHRGIYGLGLPEGTEALRAAVTAFGGVVSHDAAAVLWGLEMVHRPRLVLSVPRNRSGRKAPQVRLVRADVRCGDVDVRSGLRVTSPLRTVVDCARDLPTPEAVVIVDSALRNGLFSLDELLRAAYRMMGAKAGRVRRVVGLADPKAGSVLEALLRVLLVEHGLAPDETQHAIRDDDGTVVARVDFAYLGARLIVEADGFEFHRERGDYRKDRRRANAFCRLDWRLLRFTWEDVRFDPPYVVEAVSRELAKPLRRTPAPTRATGG